AGSDESLAPEMPSITVELRQEHVLRLVEAGIRRKLVDGSTAEIDRSRHGSGQKYIARRIGCDSGAHLRILVAETLAPQERADRPASASFVPSIARASPSSDATSRAASSLEEASRASAIGVASSDSSGSPVSAGPGASRLASESPVFAWYPSRSSPRIRAHPLA